MIRRLKTGVWRIGTCGQMAVLAMVAGLAGCAYEHERLQMVVDENAGSLYDKGSGWHGGSAEVNGWTLALARKGAGVPERIYIEGDGRAFISRNSASGDPTPVNPVGLRLALRDTHANVLYVARPCQWGRGPECRDLRMWTEKRFTDDVAERYAALVARETQGQPVELVGYSGGAWVALQVAARLPNVTRVVTVAGNLSPNWVNRQHKVMTMDVAPYPRGRLAEVPVVAYTGLRDAVVKPGMVDAYRVEVGARDVQEVDVDATHGEGWGALRIE